LLFRHRHSPIRPVSFCDWIPRGLSRSPAPVAHYVNAFATNLIPVAATGLGGARAYAQARRQVGC
jgi:hypothetical protein